MFGDRVYLARVAIFLCATAISVIPTISIQVPQFSTLDIFRIKFNTSLANNINEVRFGVWSFCLHRSSLEGEVCDNFSPCNLTETLRLCSEQKYGYELTVTGNGEFPATETLRPVWTRALASHAAASVVMVICLILLCINCTHTIAYAVALLVSFITFLSDIAVIYHTQALVEGLGDMILSQKYLASNGFVMQLFSGLWLLVEFLVDWHEPKEESNTHFHIPLKVLRLFKPDKEDASKRETEGLKTSSASRSPSPVSQASPVLQHATHRKATDGFPGKECSICMERKMDLSELSCKHVLCTDCLNKAVGIYSRCPICNRGAVKPDVRRVSQSSFV